MSEMKKAFFADDDSKQQPIRSIYVLYVVYAHFNNNLAPRLSGLQAFGSATLLGHLGRMITLFW